MIPARLLGVSAGTCFGTLALLTNLYYDSGGGPFDLVFLRLVGAAIVVWLLIVVLRQPRPDRRGALRIALVLGVFQVGHNLSLLIAYDHAPVALVVLLLYTFPLVVTLGDSLFFGESFGRRKALALCLGMAGTTFTVGTPDSAPLVGMALGLMASVMLAGYVLTARSAIVSTGAEPLQIIALGYTAPALVLGLAGAVRGIEAPGPSGWLYASGIVLIGTILASFLFYTAVPKIGAGTASILTLIDPAMSLLLAYLFLGEGLSGTKLVGGTLIIFCVLTVALPQRSGRVAPLPQARR